MSTFESIVGLEVTDEAAYQNYRDGMLPILERYGGGFRYDFRIEETLKSETDAQINRLFLIYFPDRAARDGFFSDAEYLVVRRESFEPAVAATTIIAEYER